MSGYNVRIFDGVVTIEAADTSRRTDMPLDDARLLATELAEAIAFADSHPPPSLYQPATYQIAERWAAGAAAPTQSLLEAVRRAELMSEQIPRWADDRDLSADRRKCPDNYVLDLCAQVQALAKALADAATEAECGHEMGGLAETILNRNGLSGLRDYALKYGPECDPELF